MHTRIVVAMLATLVVCSVAAAEVFVGPQAPERDLGIVQNSYFERGGMSYADHWRPLPGALRMHRTQRDTGEHSLYLELREGGDAGVAQTVDLPARRDLSLRVLATCHAEADCAVVATLTRMSDGQVLAELVVDGIERGVLAQAFETGSGGPAELMVRVVGEKGGRALIDQVTIARPVATSHARRPDYSGADLLLAKGAGLRVDADFEPRLLPQAARMLQEAIEDLTGAPTTTVGAGVTVLVDHPQATEWPEREAYHLNVRESGVTISAHAEEGAFRGMMTLIDLLRAEPGGGVRVVAVNARDRPALPWRVGSDPALAGATCTNAARRLALLKLNMALVPRDDTGPGTDEEAAAALREVGIEPVVVVSGDAACGVRAAMADAVERLDARYLFVSPPLIDEPTPGAPLPWDAGPLADVAASAREYAGKVTVIVPAAARTRADGAKRVDGVVVSVDGWPREVVAAVYPSRSAEQCLERLRELDAAGVRSIVYHFGLFDGASRSLAARASGLRCMGTLISPDAPEGADLAWRGLRAGE